MTFCTMDVIEYKEASIFALGHHKWIINQFLHERKNLMLHGNRAYNLSMKQNLIFTMKHKNLCS